ncbi:MAG: DUF2474 family protein [Alphaproteobacteria bacterium]|nr:DUF2474 family protein [Alphaproteobacteria bacterium]
MTSGPRTRHRRLRQALWFVGLWAAGVITVGIVAGVIRLLIPH